MLILNLWEFAHDQLLMYHKVDFADIALQSEFQNFNIVYIYAFNSYIITLYPWIPLLLSTTLITVLFWLEYGALNVILIRASGVCGFLV